MWSINRDADEFKLSKAYKMIDNIANNLNLQKHIVEESKRLYKLTQSKNWVQGRHTSHVVAAAMYTVCRKERTPHLLIDFSDFLGINLYTLGGCYLKLIKFLHFEMPVIDPSLFIHRFCAKLEFGDKHKEVSMTALRLVQRMKRDWMSHGRRPTGLVGAAILIAAKYHGFKRTTNQIVQTVHVCDETIRKRLVEFKQTPIARLTREEFEKIDLEKDIKGECDPPSFKKARTSEILKITNYEKELAKKAKQIEDKINEETEGDDKAVEDESKALVPVGAGGGDMELDEDEIESYILSKEESAVKSRIWHNMHKEWLEEQELKDKKRGKSASGVKRRKKTKEVVDAADPVSAILNSKIGMKVDETALTHLFQAPHAGKAVNDDEVQDMVHKQLVVASNAKPSLLFGLNIKH